MTEHSPFPAGLLSGPSGPSGPSGSSQGLHITELPAQGTALANIHLPHLPSRKGWRSLHAIFSKRIAARRGAGASSGHAGDSLSWTLGGEGLLAAPGAQHISAVGLTEMDLRPELPLSASGLPAQALEAHKPLRCKDSFSLGLPSWEKTFSPLFVPCT